MSSSPDPASMIVIFRAMLKLLATGHSKGCYARSAEADDAKRRKARSKSIPSQYGNRGGHRVWRDSPNARHFSITGAYLRACDSCDVPLVVEWACLKLLEQEAESMGGKLPEGGLEDWNDNKTTPQAQIIAVVNRAIDLVVAEASSPTSSSKGPRPCSTQPPTKPSRQPAELLL